TKMKRFNPILKLAFPPVLLVAGLAVVRLAALLQASPQFVYEFCYSVIDNQMIRNGHKAKVIGDFANSGLSSVGALTVGQGFKLYQYPDWSPHVISTYDRTDASEDACTADINGDGALDIVIGGLSGTTYWLENPLMQGRDPYNSRWAAHLIGS